MWIEVVGLPGVGKTTFIDRNLHLIQENFEVITSRSPTHWNLIAARLYYHLSFKWYLKDKSLARKLAHRSSFRFQSRARNMLFYDSGLIQVVLENLIQTNFEGKREKINLLKRLKLPDRVIYVQDDLGVVLERELNRCPRRFPFDRYDLHCRYLRTQEILERELLSLVDKVCRVNPRTNPAIML